MPTDTANLLHLLGFVDDLDALRAICRMSVVPDQAGTGIAVKTLAAVAHVHPLSVTTMGLRGLDPAVAAMLPACTNAESLAADIRSVLSSTETLTQRQLLVQAVQQAIQPGQGFSQWLATLDAPSDAVLADRAAKWQQAVAPARQIEAAPPYVFAPDVSFTLTGTRFDEDVLIDGWHGPETWGRWTDGADAGLHITLDTPIEEACAILLDVVPPPNAASLSLRVEDAESRAGRSDTRMEHLVCPEIRCRGQAQSDRAGFGSAACSARPMREPRPMTGSSAWAFAPCGSYPERNGRPRWRFRHFISMTSRFFRCTGPSGTVR